MNTYIINNDDCSGGSDLGLVEFISAQMPQSKLRLPYRTLRVPLAGKDNCHIEKGCNSGERSKVRGLEPLADTWHYDKGPSPATTTDHPNPQPTYQHDGSDY